MSRKTAEVELFGKKVTLSQRQAVDVLDTYEVAQQGGDVSREIRLRVIVIEQSLKIKHRFSRKYGKRYLIRNLSLDEIVDLSDKVFELEGATEEPKKKVAESPSAEKSPEP